MSDNPKVNTVVNSLALSRHIVSASKQEAAKIINDSKEEARQTFLQVVDKEKDKIRESFFSELATRARLVERVKENVFRVMDTLAREVVHEEARLNKNAVIARVQGLLQGLMPETKALLTLNPAHKSEIEDLLQSKALLPAVSVIFSEDLKPGEVDIESHGLRLKSSPYEHLQKLLPRLSILLDNECKQK